MLAEILANPVAWPLWAVLAFAATMYPLGLLMPGCVCCGSGCTECGFLPYGDAPPQNHFGRMCCNGTISASVTVRVTSVGPSLGTQVVRGFGFGSQYFKTTTTYPCTAKDGDYVLALIRTDFSNPGVQYFCRWETGLTIEPFTNGAWPNWRLRMSSSGWGQTWTVTTLTQQCTGHPGIESCNTGTTTTANVNCLLRTTANGTSFDTAGFSIQKCNPAGVLISSSAALRTTSVDLGCRVSVELV